MAANRIVALGFLYGLLCCTPVSLMADAKNIPKMKPAERALVSSFSVIDGKVIPQNPDQETCDSDNTYMLSAFDAIGISLKNYDYRVEVTKETHIKIQDSDSGDFVLFHYETEFIDLDYARKKSFPKLSDNKLSKTYIAASEAPTTCYAFLASHSLNLLCHYGLKHASKIAEIIEDSLQKGPQRSGSFK